MSHQASPSRDVTPEMLCAAVERYCRAQPVACDTHAMQLAIGAALDHFQPAAEVPHLFAHALEELLQLGYSVKDGDLMPPESGVPAPTMSRNDKLAAELVRYADLARDCGRIVSVSGLLERTLREAAEAFGEKAEMAPLTGTAPRANYVTAARVYALAYGRHDDATSYLPRTQSEADVFEPHAWVIGAMMQAFGEGWADGHAAGIAFMKEAAQAEQAEPRRLSPFDAVAEAMRLASLMGGSIGMSDVEKTKAYEQRLRSHLIEFMYPQATPAKAEQAEKAQPVAPRAFRTPEPGTPWWQTAKDCGAWTDRSDGDVGYVHFGSVEALRVYTMKVCNQARAAATPPAAPEGVR